MNNPIVTVRMDIGTRHYDIRLPGDRRAHRVEIHAVIRSCDCGEWQQSYIANPSHGARGQWACKHTRALQAWLDEQAQKEE